MFRTGFSIYIFSFTVVFPLEIPPLLFVDNVHLTILYATPNILEILKTKIKLHFKEGESPNSISFIYQPSYRIRLIDHDVQRLTSSQPVKMKTQSMQSKGLAVLKMMILSTEKALGCNDFGGQAIQLFFPQLAKKIQSQGSSYDSVIMGSLQRIQIDLSHKFDLLILICVTRGRANQGVSAV